MLAKPVYITVPTNIAYAKISAKPLLTPLDVSWSTNDPATETEAVREIIEMIHSSKKPIVLADAGAIKFRPGKVIDLMHELIDKTNLPIFVTPMGKGSVDETNPRYGGVYIGQLSTATVKAAVEAADLVLHIGGHKTDLNTGSFSFAFSASQTVEFHSDKIKVRYASYPGIAMKPVLRKVIDGLDLELVKEKYTPTFAWPAKEMSPESPGKAIEHAWFWPRLEKFLRPNDIVITDAGTAFFGLLDVRFPKNVMSINQLMWSAIGYSVGAALGACIGARDLGQESERRVVLIVGDGSLQISVQELSTMIWKNFKPTIFVLNNAGYTVERFIHGPEEEYNDINSSKLPSRQRAHVRLGLYGAVEHLRRQEFGVLPL
jgi:pyruvate decarboxylase